MNDFPDRDDLHGAARSLAAGEVWREPRVP